MINQIVKFECSNCRNLYGSFKAAMDCQWGHHEDRCRSKPPAALWFVGPRLIAECSCGFQCAFVVKAEAAWELRGKLGTVADCKVRAIHDAINPECSVSDALVSRYCRACPTVDRVRLDPVLVWAQRERVLEQDLNYTRYNL